MPNTQTYLIHDNGDRPFKVVIIDDGDIIEVYKNDGSTSPVEVFCPNKIFIGESKLSAMTEFSAGYGDNFRGNSILLEIDGDEDGYEYEFIGKEIFSFHTCGKILRYESPVGNNDVPYPYAIDEVGNVFLLIEDVVLLHTPPLRDLIQNEKDLYDYYYSLRIIATASSYWEPIIEDFEGITEYYIEDEQYTFIYNPDVDYDEILNRNEGQYMYIVQNGVKIELTKRMYEGILSRFGELIKVEKLYKTGLHPGPAAQD